MNNIVSNSHSAVLLPPLMPNISIVNGYNDFYNNTSSSGWGGYSPGAGTLTLNPMYAGAADYRLQSNSPLIGKGTTNPPGGLPSTDHRGFPRGQNLPDIGAYEDSLLYSSDSFDDYAVDPSWTYNKGTWMEDYEYLIAQSSADATTSMLTYYNCTMEVTLEPTGKGTIWIRGWYQDKKNYVELKIVPAKGKFAFKQRVTGGKSAASANLGALTPYESYRVRIRFDADNFQVSVNDQVILTQPKAGDPFGQGITLKSKGSDLRIDQLQVFQN
jgi:hypothetical protein